IPLLVTEHVHGGLMPVLPRGQFNGYMRPLSAAIISGITPAIISGIHTEITLMVRSSAGAAMPEQFDRVPGGTDAAGDSAIVGD
ncbi:MAG: hypothetical protein AAGH78_04615, partial [Cyanobacteria bacterium P01_H01_bin.58]